MRLRLHHVDVITEDLEESVSFYTGSLGMKVAGWFYREDLFEFVFLRDRLGMSNLVIELCAPPLLDWQEKILDHRGPCLDHFSFIADDIDRWHEELKQKNSQIIQPPEPVLGAREMYFKDPSGVILEIITTTDPALTPMVIPKAIPLENAGYRVRNATIISTDLQQSEEFYLSALGLEHVGEGQGSHSEGISLTDYDAVARGSLGPVLEIKGLSGLSKSEQSFFDEFGSGLSGIGFDVEDITLAERELQGYGLDLDAQLHKRGKPTRLVFQDPNGIQIVVIQRSQDPIRQSFNNKH